MYEELDFDEWLQRVKAICAQRSITLPEDMELMELAHMECRADEKPIAVFVEELAAEQAQRGL